MAILLGRHTKCACAVLLSCSQKTFKQPYVVSMCRPPTEYFNHFSKEMALYERGTGASFASPK